MTKRKPKFNWRAQISQCIAENSQTPLGLKQPKQVLESCAKNYAFERYYGILGRRSHWQELLDGSTIGEVPKKSLDFAVVNSSVAVPDISRQPNDLCEEYRSRWTVAASGVANVADFIISTSTSSLADADRGFVVRVIQVDLEQSWSHWSTYAEEQVRQSISPDLLVEQWKQLPRFQNYAELFNGPEEMCRYWAQLANIEAVCRDRWGDAIGTHFYQRYFEVATDGLARRQRRHVRCEFDHNEDFSQVLFPLRGRNEIGRQRSRDTEPYFYECNPDGNRIVVANRYESEVSREQLTLQLLTPNVAIITNRSGVNSIRLAPDTVLSPGTKACAIFPFTIQIPGRKLCCY